MIFTILEASKAQVKTLQNHDVIRLIYLGNGMMVSAGDPIKYADIHSSYWQKYLSGFGRLSK